MGRKLSYGKGTNILDLVQVCRRARMSWEEADEFLQKNDIKISRRKFYQTKAFLRESVSDRIQYIAYTEFADMHLQLLDSARQMFSELERMELKAKKEDDLNAVLKVQDMTIKAIHLVKELYNSSTIVGGFYKLIEEKLGKDKQIE